MIKKYDMTWGDLVKAVKAAGVKDEDEIWYIDLSAPSKEDFEKERIVIGRDERLGLSIA